MVGIYANPNLSAFGKDIPGYNTGKSFMNQFSLFLDDGGQVTINGPAAGYVRFFDELMVISAAPNINLASVVGSFVSPDTIGTVKMIPTVTGAGQNGYTIPALVNGESFIVANGASAAGFVNGTYYDIKMGSRYRAGRYLITDELQDIIPVPSHGVAKFAMQRVCQVTFSYSVGYLGPSFCAFNNDVDTHALELFLNTGVPGSEQVIARGIALAGAQYQYFGSYFGAKAESFPIAAKLFEAVDTNPVPLAFIYEIEN